MVWIGKIPRGKPLVTCEEIPFSNFSCMFLNPNNFFQFEFYRTRAIISRGLYLFLPIFH